MNHIGGKQNTYEHNIAGNSSSVLNSTIPSSETEPLVKNPTGNGAATHPVWMQPLLTIDVTLSLFLIKKALSESKNNKNSMLIKIMQGILTLKNSIWNLICAKISVDKSLSNILPYKLWHRSYHKIWVVSN